MCRALQQILIQLSTQYNIFIGDFNINYLVDNTLKRSLYNLFIRDHKYRQLVSCYTTDYRTAIDHIYTNLPESQINMQVLEAYFSDHKAICALINSFWFFYHGYPAKTTQCRFLLSPTCYSLYAHYQIKSHNVTSHRHYLSLALYCDFFFILNSEPTCSLQKK